MVTLECWPRTDDAKFKTKAALANNCVSTPAKLPFKTKA